MSSTDNKAQEVQQNQNDEHELLQVGLNRKNKFLPELVQIAKKIATRGRGILAADESTGTIGKRFATIELENNEENRRAYRELLFTSKDIGKYISGVIMYEETLFQSTKDGKKFVDVLKENGVVPGIKVDKGTKNLPYSKDDLYTEGLDGLDDRCKKYYQQGARFAKWRAVVKIVNNSVSRQSIEETAWTLARYAAICQENGLVPIVEPELLIDGTHSLEVCQYWQQIILASCYKALLVNEVILEGTLLKPSMVLPGESYEGNKSIEKNAAATVVALLRSVPCAVPGIMFLSGGQSEEEATLHLNAINKDRNLPWTVSFSYGRALQDSCLKAWKGKKENVAEAQNTFIKRAKANSEAQLGVYKGDAATDSSKQSLFKKGYVY